MESSILTPIEFMLNEYEKLTDDAKMKFLIATGDLPKAAIASELSKNKITGVIRELILNDRWLRDSAIINEDTVSHVADELDWILKETRFFYLKKNDRGKNFYVMLMFDPTDPSVMPGKNRWSPPEGTEIQPFSIEKLDPAIEPFEWEIYGDCGELYELMPMPARLS